MHSSLKNRIQRKTDGQRPYLIVEKPLLGDGGVDFAMLHKNYGTLEGPSNPERTYSPAFCTGIDKRVNTGNPDLISTSYVERQYLTIRMGMCRFTYRTHGFSKKFEKNAHAVSLHFMHYNFARPHHTLTKKFGTPTAPASAAGKADHVWSAWEIAELL